VFPDDLAGADVDAEDGVDVVGVAHGVGTVADDRHGGVADPDVNLPHLSWAILRPGDVLGGLAIVVRTAKGRPVSSDPAVCRAEGQHDGQDHRSAEVLGCHTHVHSGASA
jgi:hypothetical protein